MIIFYFAPTGNQFRTSEASANLSWIMQHFLSQLCQDPWFPWCYPRQGSQGSPRSDVLSVGVVLMMTMMTTVVGGGEDDDDDIMIAAAVSSSRYCY